MFNKGYAIGHTQRAGRYVLRTGSYLSYHNIFVWSKIYSYEVIPIVAKSLRTP